MVLRIIIFILLLYSPALADNEVDGDEMRYPGSGTAVPQFKDLILTDLDATEEVANFLHDITGNGVLDSCTITETGGLNVQWGECEFYVNEKIIVIAARGTDFALTDNATNYFYGTIAGDTTMQVSTTPPTGEFASIAIKFTIGGAIEVQYEELLLHELGNAVHDSLAALHMNTTSAGMVTAEDADVTNVNDFTVSAGKYYFLGDTLVDTTLFYSAGVGHAANELHRYFHSGGAWTNEDANGVDFDFWDDGTDKDTDAVAKWYSGSIWLHGTAHVDYVYPQAEHGSRTAADAEPMVEPPNHSGWIVPLAKFVFRGGTTSFTNPSTAYFTDTRSFHGTGGGPSGAAQALWATISSDTGATTANDTLDTLTIAGGTGIETSITGDTVTVTGHTATVEVDPFAVLADGSRGWTLANSTLSVEEFLVGGEYFPAFFEDAGGGIAVADALLVYDKDNDGVVSVAFYSDDGTVSGGFGWIEATDTFLWLDHIAVLTGKNFTVGSLPWNSGDNIDGAAIADSTVDSDTLASNSVDSDELVNGSVDEVHTSITGVPDGTLYLRDDWSWQAIGGAGALTVQEIDTNPSANAVTTINVTNGTLTKTDETEVTITIGAGGGGDVATDAIWDAVGDIAKGTGANTADVLSLGTQNQVLRVGASTIGWENNMPGGDTLPSTGNENAGDFYFYTPTGGTVWQYNGSAWVPHASYIALNIYVGKNGGADTLTTQNRGTSGVPFLTVQAAINAIPSSFTGDINVYVSCDNGSGADTWTAASANTEETYTENVIIQGKSPTGDFSIYVIGTFDILASGTQAANGVQGTGATRAEVHVTTLAGFGDKLIYLDADGQYRLIDSVDTAPTPDEATIVSTFASQPLSGENYIVYDWASKIDGSTTGAGIFIASGQKSVVIKNSAVTSSSVISLNNAAIMVGNFAEVKLLQAEITTGGTGNTRGVQSDGGISSVFLDTTFVTSGANHTVTVFDAGAWLIWRSKLQTTKISDRALLVIATAYVQVNYGSVIEATGGGTGYCIYNRSSAINMFSAASTGYNVLRTAAIGIYAEWAGFVVNTSNVQNSCATPESIAGGSDPAYID